MGGVIINLEEKTKVNYAWGLGVTFNNQAKVVSLWEGLKNCLDKGVNSLSIVGDSKVISQNFIRLLGNDLLLKDESSPVMIRIIHLLKRFEKVELFHMLRANNNMEDIQANVGVILGRGVVCINKLISSLCPIP